MIRRLSLEIADYLFYRRIISIDKYDVYSYGLEMIISTLAEIVDNERETFQPVNNAISPRGTLRSYMIGDVDQDNRIDASDASTILHAVSVYEDAFNDDVLPVNYANAHLSTYFPKASRAESADANKNDSITEKDASLVLQYYANASTGNTDPVAHVSEIVYYIE